MPVSPAAAEGKLQSGSVGKRWPLLDLILHVPRGFMKGGALKEKEPHLRLLVTDLPVSWPCAAAQPLSPDFLHLGSHDSTRLLAFELRPWRSHIVPGLCRPIDPSVPQ